ncbi:MAG: hypothetical protein JST86_00530 [Bacteroidetes bacterium]|nr:hypothetical protein [Bacteroidota bacterium]
MTKGIIRFSFQKTISEQPVTLWDKYVFDATWMEYRMQAANFNQKTKDTLFTNILAHEPRAAQLHQMVSTAALGYIRQLEGIIPELLTVHGKALIPFKNFQFNIVQSDMIDSRQHKVDITFISEPLTLIDTFNHHFLIAIGDKSREWVDGKEILTELIPQSGALGIYSVQAADGYKPS